MSEKETKGLSLRLQVPLGEHGPQKQLSRGRVGSLGLKRQSPSLHGSELEPLHSCCGCLAWCFSRTPHNGRGGVSDSFASSLDPYFPTGLLGPALIGLVPGLVSCNVISVFG